MKDPLEDGWLSGESFAQFLARRGVTRREFLSFCGKMAVIMGAGAAASGRSRALAREVAAKLQGAQRPSVVYLQLQECTGCLESLLRSGSTPVEALVLEQISLEYNELLMAPSGEGGEGAVRLHAAGRLPVCCRGGEEGQVEDAQKRQCHFQGTKPPSGIHRLATSPIKGFRHPSLQN